MGTITTAFVPDWQKKSGNFDFILDFFASTIITVFIPSHLEKQMADGDGWLVRASAWCEVRNLTRRMNQQVLYVDEVRQCLIKADLAKVKVIVDFIT